MTRPSRTDEALNPQPLKALPLPRMESRTDTSEA
jgi:hypothetical protein